MIAFILIAAWASAELPKDCPVPMTAESIHSWPVDEGTAFFLRAAPGTREVSFASATTTQTSRILNVDTGKEIPVDGEFDPILTPDGKVLVVPQAVFHDGRTGKQGFRRRNSTESKPAYLVQHGGAYDMSDGERKLTTLTLEQVKKKAAVTAIDYGSVYYVRDEHGTPRASYVESTQPDYYSMGSVRQSDQTSYYRNLWMNESGLVYRDVRLDSAANKVEPVGQVRPVCSETIRGSMPMISADGREFSIYDAEN